MTECERIIQSGLLPESFFREEIRDGFLVDAKRKKIWAVSLDLLSHFKKVCEKHGLRWYLMFGTLLGAVRHKGFIPWDDDIDIAMPRSDYEKLITLSEEFSYPYFLQTPYTDKGFYFSFAKIRNSNTTSLSRGFCYQGFNQGCHLDVFIVDNWRMEGGEALYEDIKRLIIDNSNYMRMSLPNPNEYHKKRISQYSGNDPLENYENIQKLSKTYYGEDTEYVCLPTVTVYGYKRDVFRAEDFSETISVRFEDSFQFPIPKGYDSILSTIYGDYMQFPPVEERGQWHNDGLLDIDPDVSYLKKRAELPNRNYIN